ncbi:MAG: rhodanese-like domain-containing protein [Flavobacteriaceae bacterium]|nr:rhodanese-like domain-containing protein [Flavobacteriaceae bacterium]
MKRFILLLLITSAFTFSCKETTEENIKLVTPEEMKELSQMDGVQLVDVRTPEEFEEGHIKGFQNIDFMSDTFQEDLEKLDKTKPVIVYCKSGNRSGKSCKIMKEKGFVKVYDLEGGIEQWKYEGNKVEILLP